MQFSVVEPIELAGVRVVAYYRGVPDIDGRRLKLGEFVYFRLPSAPLRHGILLWDLKGLRVGKRRDDKNHDHRTAGSEAMAR